ncbi:MAG: hypothetical protein AMJ81_12715 [Phycisphaerae bacterium SM23_33]|nr:MAG: hypothetical protein AMJ81_12715 [Phycisphaerae bacterium SM23_33]
MPKISFSMAGSGNWQRWFPDDAACALYERIYPGGAALDELAAEQRRRVQEWQAPGFVKIDRGNVSPLVPVFTDEDESELATWFSQVGQQAAAVVAGRIGEYRELAEALSGRGGVPSDYLLTILLCAHTLDVGTLEELHKGILGSPPARAGGGHYFFWGRTARSDGTYGFGVNTNRLFGELLISLIHSPRVERALPGQGAIVIPVLDSAAMQSIRKLCVPVSRRLAEAFSANVDLLEDRLVRCSFAKCSRPDYLCMLFHMGYAHTAAALVEAGLLPAFPARADDAWGVWIRPSQ